MAKGKSWQIGSSTLGLGLFLVIFGFTLILVPVIVGNPIEVKKRSPNICENVDCQPGYQCCDDSERCGQLLGQCEKCISGTFSAGGSARCENCNKCEVGTNVLENCTTEKNTVCSNCSDIPGQYRHPSGICKSCTTCTGEVHCVDICKTTPVPPTTSTPMISKDKKVSATTDRDDTDNSAIDITLTTALESMLTTTVKPGSQEKWALWKTILIGVVSSPVFILAVFGLATKILCCWTEKSKKFWAEHFPCCCKKSGKNGQITRVGGTEVEERTSNGESNTVLSSVTEVSATADRDDTDNSASIEGQPQVLKKQLEQKNNNPSLSIQPQASLPKTRRNSYRRTSLSTLPEGEPLLRSTYMPSDLPDWCLKDKTRVTVDIAGQIADFIGKKMIGQALGLYKGAIETIEHDYKEDLARQNFEIIQKWITMNGVKATKCKLAQALIRVERSDVANLLWPDREILPVTPTTPLEELHFWKRRKSTDDIQFDTSVIDKMDLTERKSWVQVIKNIKKNDFGGLEELRIACDILCLKLPKLKSLTQCQSSRKFEVDEFGTSLIKKFGKFTHLSAVKVTTDGNCLFSSVSVLVYGCEDRNTELRLRTVIELIKNKNYYLKLDELNTCIKYEYALTNTEDDKGLSDNDIEAHFNGSVRDTLKDGEPVISLQGNSIQLFGLASVLGCNIQSVYPTSDSSPLNILIQPRNKVENPVTAYIMWSMHKGLSEEEQNFIPNHFVPLLEEYD